MFIFSVRSTKFKLVILAVAVIAVALIFIFSMDKNKTADNDVTQDTSFAVASEINYSAKTEEDRLAFISQFGWKVRKEPCEICEVIIPSEFDDTYNEYNKIQLAQGLDLKPYANCRVKKWTYIITNYKGYEDNSECIRINLLIYEGSVIGGDVCSIELGGFMHGFSD